MNAGVRLSEMRRGGGGVEEIGLDELDRKRPQPLALPRNDPGRDDRVVRRHELAHHCPP
jgi:hypothetical protein